MGATQSISVSPEEYSTRMEDIGKWSVETVASELASWGLSHARENFVQNQVDGQLLLRLTYDGFVELGLGAVESSRLLNHLDKFRNPKSNQRRPEWDESNTAAKMLIESCIKSSSKMWKEGQYYRAYEMYDDVATLLISRPLKDTRLTSLNLEQKVAAAQRRANKRAEQSSPKKAAVILRKCFNAYLKSLHSAINDTGDSYDSQPSLRLVELESQIQSMEEKYKSMEAYYKRQLMYVKRAPSPTRPSTPNMEGIKKKCRRLENENKQLRAKCILLETGRQTNSKAQGQNNVDATTQMCSLFSTLDKYGNGEIRTPQLMAHIDTINSIFSAVHNDAVPFKDAKDVLKHFDSNNDGVLIFSEFSDGFMKTNNPGSSPQVARTRNVTPNRTRSEAKQSPKQKSRTRTPTRHQKSSPTPPAKKDFPSKRIKAEEPKEANIRKPEKARHEEHEPSAATPDLLAKEERIQTQDEETSVHPEKTNVESKTVISDQAEQTNEKRVIYLSKRSAEAFNEFIDVLHEHVRENNHLGLDEAILETFNVFDEDHSGEIDTTELHHAMLEMGIGSEGDSDLSDEAAQEILEHFGASAAGTIDLEQFRKILYITVETLPNEIV
jgi:Ca2+-binding EF-hand superfamily protein